MQYFVIGDDDTVLGFSLVGVSGRAVHTVLEAENAWNEALENKEWAIILITKDAADLIREKVDSFLFSESFPLIVELSSPSGETRDLKELVNEAIGVSL